MRGIENVHMQVIYCPSPCRQDVRQSVALHQMRKADDADLRGGRSTEMHHARKRCEVGLHSAVNVADERNRLAPGRLVANCTRTSLSIAVISSIYQLLKDYLFS